MNATLETAVDEGMLNAMAREIVAAVAPCKVVLFGSRARDTANEHSDVDLLVVCDGPFGPGNTRRSLMRAIRERLGRFHVPTDILVYSSSEVETWKGYVNHVIARALEEGRVLYERQ